MPKRSDFTRIVLTSIVVLVPLLLLFSFVYAQVENDDLAKVRLIIHILDIDQSQKTVDLKIIVCISNFPYNESRVGVWVIGAGDTIIWCNNTGAHMVSTWYYQGESEQTTWLLEGMGEHFPFDSYNLRFEVYDVYFINHNFTLSSEGHQAFFTGSKAYSLKDLWKTDNGLIPIEYIKTEEIAFAIGRSDNALSIAILQFLIPIIGCYYLLGATLMLNPKEKLAERLRIHLSLFVFVPTFLIAIQKFLPYRSSLSFPEFLLVNLIVSNTLFGIFSIFGNQKNSRKQKVTYSRWDLIASNLSLVLFMIIYLFTLFGRINIPASLIFTYIVVPSYICFYFAVMSKEQIKKQILGIAVFIILALIPLIFILISTL